jgi:sugar lactone lactonase YvrE
MEHHHRKKTIFMSTYAIQTAFATPSLLGECPVWQEEEAALYWIDIVGQGVHRLDPATGAHASWELPSEPGCLACTNDRRLIVAMRTAVVFLDPRSGAITPVAEAPYDVKRMRFNDGRCDAAGRFWAGTLYEPRDLPAGSLFCVERGRLRNAGNPVTVSNGLAFSPDNRTLYHADTTAHRIMAYDFNVATGEIGEGRLFHQFSADREHDYGGRPDGAAVDVEGAYWCAMYEGGRLLRISSEGTILREIRLPVRCPTMIAFGAADLRTLYITTSRNNRPPQELQQYPLSGCVLSVRVDVPGCAGPAYVV